MVELAVATEANDIRAHADVVGPNCQSSVGLSAAIDREYGVRMESDRILLATAAVWGFSGPSIGASGPVQALIWGIPAVADISPTHRSVSNYHRSMWESNELLCAYQAYRGT